MKSIFALLIAILLALPIQAQESHTPTAFPDETFRSYVETALDQDRNGSLSQAERDRVRFLDLSYRPIADLSGIEAFPNLEVLDLTGTNLSRLDLDLPKLRILRFRNTPIAQMNLNTPKLEVLVCDDFQGETLSLSLPRLEQLSAMGSQISQADLDLPKLRVLNLGQCHFLQDVSLEQMPLLESVELSDTQISQVSVASEVLREFRCDGSKLTQLSLEAPYLQVLHAADNDLETLFVASGDLQEVQVSGNRLTTLELSEQYLRSLDISQNPLTELKLEAPALESLRAAQMPQLQSLVLDAPVLSELDLSETGLSHVTLNFPKLQSLSCGNSPLGSLDVSGCPELRSLLAPNAQLHSLDLSQLPLLRELNLNGNPLTQLDLSQNPALEMGIFQDLQQTESQVSGLDPEKILSMENCTLENGILCRTGETGQYVYDAGNGFSMTVTLHSDRDPVALEAFPDLELQAFLRAQMDRDGNGLLSDWERQAEHLVLSRREISDFTGLSYFPNLQSLSLEQMPVQSLSLSHETLRELGISGGSVTDLDLHTPNLETLTINDTPMEILGGDFPNLTLLNASKNALSRLEIQAPKLYILMVSDNRLPSLDLSGYPLLNTAICGGNDWTEWDLSHPTLEYLELPGHSMTRLSVAAPMLYSLQCQDGALEALELDTPELNQLNASRNRLSSLTLDGPKLQTLLLAHNQLKELNLDTPVLVEADVQDNALTEFYLGYWLRRLNVSQNQISSLDFWETPYLSRVDCSENPLDKFLYTAEALQKLDCGGTKLSHLDGSQFPQLVQLDRSFLPGLSMDPGEFSGLTALNVDFCQLDVLDLQAFPNLQSLSCSGNRLHGLDLSPCTQIQEVRANQNLLTTLSVSDLPLWLLEVNDNLLNTLSLHDLPYLGFLAAQNNRLEALEISHLPELYGAAISGNRLTALPELPAYCSLTALSNVRPVYGDRVSRLSPGFDVQNVRDLTGGYFDDGCFHLEEDRLDYRYTVDRGTLEVSLLRTREDPFSDVDPADYFYEPVLWAMDQGITQGMTPETFAPGQSCQRGQAVTFLWRFRHSPKVSGENPFADVGPEDYFYEPVLWALDADITKGMSAAAFGPGYPVSRAQFVTFLWRMSQSPAPTSTDTPFTDISPADYYYEAVLWAVENGLTQGMTPQTFGPDLPCERGQIVTFLYRMEKDQ